MNSTRIIPPLTSTGFFMSKEPEKQAEKSGNDVVIAPVQEAPARKEKPTDAEAQSAMKTLLEWIGEDTSREALKDAPARMATEWKARFKGYLENPREYLKDMLPNAERYAETIYLEDVPVTFYCERTLAPVMGKAFIAYMPSERIAPRGKIIEMANGYAARLQVQESLTRQIAVCMNDTLIPRGVAVAIRCGEALTLSMSGLCDTDSRRRAEFLSIVNRAA